MTRLVLLSLLLALSGCASAKVCYYPPGELLKARQVGPSYQMAETCGRVWIWPWSPIGELGGPGTPVHVTPE